MTEIILNKYETSKDWFIARNTHNKVLANSPKKICTRVEFGLQYTFVIMQFLEC